ncbi:TetR family transcriptional regulator, partial [Mycobacterium sp. CBMA361]|nr:TetR family transcriptional regulator [Mycolicibacterium sp. CBMA 361]
MARSIAIVGFVTGDTVNNRSLSEEAAVGKGRDRHVRRTQQERREHTRRALMTAALDLTAGGSSFDALSLRQLAHKAGVAPSAFYRYFPSLDDLGLALVRETFRKLREIMGEMAAADASKGAINVGVQALRGVVARDHTHLAFLARQRAAGRSVLRREIRSEIRLYASQLATYMARFEPIQSWRVRDVDMLASMQMATILAGIDSMLEVIALGLDDDSTSCE